MANSWIFKSLTKTKVTNIYKKLGGVMTYLLTNQYYKVYPFLLYEQKPIIDPIMENVEIL